MPVSVPSWLFFVWLLAAPAGVLVGAAAGAWLAWRLQRGQSPMPTVRLPFAGAIERARLRKLNGDQDERKTPPAPRGGL